ncbi:Hpt domain-containing protein [Pseudotenacibaculum sp. MALMAid0570]|uniref:Hpt domain-containing protein n=1 Tax=Pseudotenacibaculum sp. MALMAid0570 TaxID=3143938 RepID=UPI0032E035C2
MEKPNLNYIKQLSDGDIDFENQILSVLKRELPEEFEEFLKNFKEKNFIKTAENVHKIKHKISILGLTKGYEEAALFENDLRDRRETKRYDSFVEIIKSMLDFLSPTKI